MSLTGWLVCDMCAEAISALGTESLSVVSDASHRASRNVDVNKVLRMPAIGVVVC
jgi:hypothetical protein